MANVDSVYLICVHTFDNAVNHVIIVNKTN